MVKSLKTVKRQKNPTKYESMTNIWTQTKKTISNVALFVKYSIFHCNDDFLFTGSQKRYCKSNVISFLFKYMSPKAFLGVQKSLETYLILSLQILFRFSKYLDGHRRSIVKSVEIIEMSWKFKVLIWIWIVQNLFTTEKNANLLANHSLLML